MSTRHSADTRTAHLINALIVVALGSAIISHYLSQAAILILVSVCAYHLCRERAVVPHLWVLALAFVTVAAIPMAVSSGSGRPLDAPLRYTLFIVPLLVLPLYGLRLVWILRAAGGAALLACSLVLSLDLYQDTRFDFNGVVRFDFGLGLLDSAFAAVCLLPLAVAQFVLDREHRLWSLFALASVFATVLIVVMSGTRASWLALLCTPLLAQWAMGRYALKTLLPTMVLVLLVIVVAYSFSPMVKERMNAAVENLQQYYAGEEMVYQSADGKVLENSLGRRLDLWKTAWVTFKTHPISGPNYQQRAEIKQRLIEQGEISRHIGDDGKASAHNELLNAMSHKGLLGLAAILLLYLVPGQFFWRASRAARCQEQRIIAGAGLAFVLSFAICGLAEALLMSGRLATIYALVIVVLYSLSLQYRRQ